MHFTGGIKSTVNRRTFLKLIGIGGAACPAAPVLLAGTTTANDKLDQLCWGIGKFVREHDLVPKRIIAIDGSGHLVLDGRSDKSPREINYKFLFSDDGSFYLADRNHENYTQIVYCLEPRYLMRAEELSVFVHTENGCHRFPLVFARPQEKNREVQKL